MTCHLKSKLYLIILTGGWFFDLEITPIVTLQNLCSWLHWFLAALQVH